MKCAGASCQRKKERKNENENENENENSCNSVKMHYFVDRLFCPRGVHGAALAFRTGFLPVILLRTENEFGRQTYHFEAEDEEIIVVSIPARKVIFWVHFVTWVCPLKVADFDFDHRGNDDQDSAMGGLSNDDDQLIVVGR